MPESALSRRVSEFAGVALFALALIWMLALGSYSAADPVWFFKTASPAAPSNFAGRIGAFLAEASFQLLGYAAWLAPVVVGVVGWKAFWCHKLQAAYTKLVGVVLMLASFGALLSLVFKAVGAAPRAFPAGGVLGDWFAGLVSDYLNMTGGTILLVMLLALSIIVSTHFSFGRALSGSARAARQRGAAFAARLKERREARRRDRERRQIVAKHVKKAAGRTGNPEEIATKAQGAAAALKAIRTRLNTAGAADDENDDNEDQDGDEMRAAPRPLKPPAIRRPAPTPVPGTLPLAGAEAPKPPAERRGAYTLPPLTLLDAPKDQRKIDERELMDAARLLEEKCREFSVEGSVVQIHPGRWSRPMSSSRTPA